MQWYLSHNDTSLQDILAGQESLLCSLLSGLLHTFGDLAYMQNCWLYSIFREEVPTIWHAWEHTLHERCLQGPAIPIWRIMGIRGNLLCPSLSYLYIYVYIKLLRFLSDRALRCIQQSQPQKCTSHIVTRKKKNITVGAKTTLATPCLIEPNACHCGFVRFSSIFRF